MSDHVHHWEHSINWSHAIFGLVLIVVVLEYGDTLSDVASDVDADGAASAASVMVN